MGRRLVANGISARTGLPLLTIDEDELEQRIVAAETAGGRRDDELASMGHPGRRALPFDVTPTDVPTAGWSIVFATTEDPAVRAALVPLVEHRRRTGPEENHHVHDYVPGESAIDWLARHEVNPGTVDPSRVGYYVLLVGPPSRIPFDVQYLLDVEYAVGRIHFDTPEEYARYAASVIACETGTAPPRDRAALFWGPKHAGDPATTLSAERLLTPLAAGADGKPSVATRFGFEPWSAIGQDATRGRLLKALAGGDGRPALLFTASHGVGGVPPGDPSQRLVHGALVTQDWVEGALPPGAMVTGGDVADARVHGMIAFVFACYGAGTPAIDAFPPEVGGAPERIAPEPFVAYLPRMLLGHPEGGALACIGHVERAWGYSVESKGGSQLKRFQDVVGQLLVGHPVGHAMRMFNDAHAVLSAAVTQQVGAFDGARPLSGRRLADLWLERTDAQNYVVLGDPAVHLPASADGYRTT
jgi:hypothetical protein